MNDIEAKAYLSNRYGSPTKETKKLFVFTTVSGKELALAKGTTSRATIYAEYLPQEMNLTLKLKVYSKNDSSRHSNLNSTQTLGVGNAICKYTVNDTEELTKLCSFYEGQKPKLDFKTYIDQLIERSPEDVNSWIEGYKFTNQLALNNTDSDETTYQLWKKKDNQVSSLQLGRPSNEEYKLLSQELKSLSFQIVENTTFETYQKVLSQLQQFKEDKKLKFTPRALVNRVFAAVAPELVTSTVNEHCFIQVAKHIAKKFDLSLNLNGNWFENNLEFKQALETIGSKEIDPMRVNSAIWIQFTKLGADESTEASNQVTEGKVKEYKVKSNSPLNQILYGPPGTGKTYHTIEAAVAAADPTFTNFNERNTLKERYDELVDEGRIRFVTFHQSYGYEEFVEGLKAESNSGEISYKVESGIFKQIVKAAAGIAKPSALIKVGDQFGSFSVIERTEEVIYIKKQNGRTLPMPSVVFDEVIDLVKDKQLSLPDCNAETLKELGSNLEPNFISGYHGLHTPMASQIIERQKSCSGEKQNYVLIIDEINRGNISKIFGELITLIEDSKRSGKDKPESMTLTLPYSGESFSVPDNLYIIGTMNTADRSLAMMDTALRRRFDFKEMMPDATHFDNTNIKGINLSKLLTKLNQRIEALYDREHTLGHAFFFPVKKALESHGEQVAFEKLKSVFQNKILPLLEEYFFEDWHKIRLVLGDNQKSKTEQFIKEDSVSFNELFGPNNQLDDFEVDSKQFSVASFTDKDSVWDKPEAYIGIYHNKQLDNSDE